MAAVAIAAVVLGTYAFLHRRSERFRHLATLHANKAQEAADIGWGFQRFGINSDGSIPPENAKQSARQWNKYLYHKALREKYDRASSHPWLFVLQDPPPPF
jgi:hypothetical protein